MVAVTAVRVRDERSGEETTIACRAVVSAAGAWAGKVAGAGRRDAGDEPGQGLDAHPQPAHDEARSSTGWRRRATATSSSRCTPSASSARPTSPCPTPTTSRSRATRSTRSSLDGERLVPGISGARVLRAYAGARPLYDAADFGTPHHDESREISRAHHVIDHGARDGVGGLWSIVGGKLTTYRLMARDVVDAVATARSASTRRAGRPMSRCRRPATGTPYWLGDRLAALEAEGGGNAELVCECELVTQATAGTRARRACRLVARRPAPHDPARDGPLPGRFCMPRAAAALDARRPGAANAPLRAFIAERFRGTRPIAWGDQLAELWLTAGIFRGILARGSSWPMRPTEASGAEHAAS